MTRLTSSSRAWPERIERRTERRTAPWRPPPPRHDPDIDGALDAMTGEELRSFVRDILEGLDDELRSAFLDSVIASAANSFVVARRSKGVVSHCRNSTRPNSRSVGPTLAVNATLRPYIRS